MNYCDILAVAMLVVASIDILTVTSQLIVLILFHPHSIKPGKIVIILAGRFAGRKAVVVKTFDDGSKDHEFGHALVAGIDRYPLRVTKSMSQKKILKRSKVKPFLKHVNYNHIMPTRYTISDIDLKTAIKPDNIKKAGEGRIEAKKAVKKLFEDRYLKGKSGGGAAYFFHKLRF
jgi:large subunit ribosomal protein L27e